MASWDDLDIVAAALCAYRECRGGGSDGMRAVLHVVDNRAKARKRTWAQIVYQPLQFSSMTYPHDPQLDLVPFPPDASWELAYELAVSVASGQDPDLTDGATFYYAKTITPPVWAASMVQTADIGGQLFFKEKTI